MELQEYEMTGEINGTFYKKEEVQEAIGKIIADQFATDGDLLRLCGLEIRPKDDPAENYALICCRDELAEARAENRTLRKILQDTFLIGDLCSLCKQKGHDLPSCNCNTNKACIRQLLKLYQEANNDTDGKTPETSNN